MPTTTRLVDNYQRTVLLITNAGAGADANTVVANAATLEGAVSTLQVANTDAGFFKIGETVTASGGGTATVADVANNGLTWTLINANGTFANNNTIVGSESNVTLTEVGALVPATYRFHIARISFAVSAGAAVLWWGGTGGGTNSVVAAAMSGAGEWVLPGAPLRNMSPAPTGSLLVSTMSFDANSAYTLVVELHKTSGYSKPEPDRNALIGYYSTGRV